MNKYYFNENNKHKSKAIKSQERWQKKQINIYYNIGRPLFDYYYDKGHMMYKNPFLKKEAFIF